MELSEGIRKKLHLLVSDGVFVLRKWLLKQGFTNHSIDNLVKSGQLELITKGVYKREFTKLTWQGVVLSLQSMYDYGVVVGGITALEMQGYFHYVPLNKAKQVHLYAKKALPHWIHGLLTDIDFVIHLSSELQSRKHSQLDFDNVLETSTTLFSWREDMPALQVSAPERALFELLASVPAKLSFEHAEKIMQGMTSLSPAKLQSLLMVCDNLRVRRLFLWMAEKQDHAWFKRLQLDNISIGSGNRVLIKGGVVNKKYKITVPQEYE